MEIGDLEPKCRRLLEQGRADDCRELLMRYGFVQQLDPRVQRLFDDLIEPPDAPSSALQEALDVLRAGSDLGAARAVRKVAHGNWSTHTGRWLTDPRTVDVLLAALERSEDDEEVEHLIWALGGLSQRYDVKDQRIAQALEQSFEGRSDKIKLAVAYAIAYFGTECGWALVEAALDCKPPRQAQSMVGLAVAKHGESVPPTQRARFAQKLIAACKKQRNVEAVDDLVRALRVIGDASVVDGLKEVRDRIAAPVVKETIETTIQELQNRDTGR